MVDLDVIYEDDAFLAEISHVEARALAGSALAPKAPSSSRTSHVGHSRGGSSGKENSHPALNQNQWPAPGGERGHRQAGEQGNQGLGLYRAYIAEMKAAVRKRELAEEREKRRRVERQAAEATARVADLERRLQEEATRQTSESAVIVKEVMVIADETAEPDYWERTKAHSSRGGRQQRATLFEVAPGSKEFQTVVDILQDDKKQNQYRGNAWNLGPFLDEVEVLGVKRIQNLIRRDPRTRKLASEVTVRDFVGCRNTDI